MIRSLRTTLANLLRRLADALAPAAEPRVRPKSYGGKGEER